VYSDRGEEGERESLIRHMSLSMVDEPQRKRTAQVPVLSLPEKNV